MVQQMAVQKELESQICSGSEALQAERCRNAKWFYENAIDLVKKHTIQVRIYFTTKSFT